MNFAPGKTVAAADPLSSLLDEYSVEITSRDVASLGVATAMMPQGAEIFIANLPKESADVLVDAACKVRAAGLTPVPHVVARNIASRAALEDMVARLARHAKVDTALVLAGDRDDPAGEYDSALKLIRTGVFQANGISRIRISAYPEGHPRIADDVLDQAMEDKLAAAEAAGLEVTLVGQFLFDAAQIVAFARRLRARGITAPFRVGVAGPAERTKLIKYALRCGVGASLRALKERSELARSVMSGETPDELLGEVALAAAQEPVLGISGVHFFTFGDPAGSIRWAEGQRKA